MDSDLSFARLREAYNADLANGLGNLLSRLTTLCARAGDLECRAESTPEAPSGFHEAMSRYEFDRAFDSLWTIVDAVNRDIQTIEPWKLLKSGDTAVLNEHLVDWLGQVYRFGYWLRPFMPCTAREILQAISRTPIVQSRPLFPRIGKSVE